MPLLAFEVDLSFYSPGAKTPSAPSISATARHRFADDGVDLTPAFTGSG